MEDELENLKNDNTSKSKVKKIEKTYYYHFYYYIENRA